MANVSRLNYSLIRIIVSPAAVGITRTTRQPVYIVRLIKSKSIIQRLTVIPNAFSTASHLFNGIPINHTVTMKVFVAVLVLALAVSIRSFSWSFLFVFVFIWLAW